LASSILETVDVPPATAATLGFAAGLALEAALRGVAGPAAIGFSLKWPNDVLAGQAKLSGILLEAETVPGAGLAVVVGMGTNIVAAPEGTPTPATSLAALGVATGAERLFAGLSDSWAECRGIWDNGKGFGEIRRRWLELAAGLGQPVSVHTGQATVSGIFDTIDDTGCMILRTSTGDRVLVSAGDVHFGSAASAGAA
jgi:BirA family biotin operon repressor/biotin-[acetyl-CoA-carboxylase] ligase